MQEINNRKDRRAAEATGKMTQQKFRKLADRFIDVANRENREVAASDLQLSFLYAAARYNAHVGKKVFGVTDHEKYVQEMTKVYQEMLRTHLSDPKL